MPVRNGTLTNWYCLFVFNRQDTIAVSRTALNKEAMPIAGHCCNSRIFQAANPRYFPYTTACQLTQPVVGYTAHTGHWNLVCRAALGSWSHYCWMWALLDTLVAPSKQIGFAHTSIMSTQVLHHKCDQWASANTGIVRQDSQRASRP